MTRFLSLLLPLLCLAPSALQAVPQWDPSNPAHWQKAAQYSKDNAGVALLIMRDGQIVFEDYPNKGAAHKGWELASGTKSFWGPVALIAQRDGLLRLDELVCDTITEWKADPRKRQITIRQLLNLTAGLKQSTAFDKGPLTYAAALKEPAIHAPGTVFEYGQVTYQVFGEVLRRKLKKTGESPQDYLQRTIFDPLGIQPTGWKRMLDGNPRLPSGGELTARDWAQFGELIRLQGQWNGQEVIPAALFPELFAGTTQNPAYGLTWWMGRSMDTRLRLSIRQFQTASDLLNGLAQLPPDIVMAAGAGGQRLYVIPSLKLVVVRQAPVMGQGLRGLGVRGWSDVTFLKTLLMGQP